MRVFIPTPFKSISLLAAICIVVLLLSQPVWAGGLQAGDTVAICGDSITEQKLYSVFIEDYLLMCQPVADLKVHQFGWSGERADGFLSRINVEVLPFGPTVATTCYGMNDGAYSAIDAGRQIAYRRNTQGIIMRLREAGVRLIVVGSPGLVDTDTFDRIGGRAFSATNYNNTLADLTRIAREVAVEQGVVFADVYTTMAQVMKVAKVKYGADYHVAGGDGIHPAANGHLVIAYAFLKALGCSGDIGTITWDAGAATATATAGHQVLAAGKDVIKIESARYPFCFSGNPADPNSPTGVLEFLPFNEELNRFQLVVKHGDAGRFRITWGSATKTFSAAQLESGINLAAEFPVNPFGAAFVNVDKAVREQQNFETPAVKDVLHQLPGWSKLLPEERDSLERIKAAAILKAQALGRSSRLAVKPVIHQIRITPAS